VRKGRGATQTSGIPIWKAARTGRRGIAWRLVQWTL